MNENDPNIVPKDASLNADNPKKMGRPIKPIDWKLVDQLLIAGCTAGECAAHFDMHHQTFSDRMQQQYGITFTEYAAEKRQKGESILRTKQYEKALEKDNTMLIWLGKQRLNQREPDSRLPKDESADAKLSMLADFFSKINARPQPKPEEDKE